MTKQAMQDDDVPTLTQPVKAPVALFERLDRWCEWTRARDGMTMRPSRPAAIRYILDQFLTREEERMAKRSVREAAKKKLKRKAA